MTTQTCATVPGAPVAHSEEQQTFNLRVRRSKRRGGTTYLLEQLPARMRAKITIELCPLAGLDSFCWTWTAAVTSRGYGSFSYEGRRWSTHRLSYTLLVGPIPAGLVIDHLCRNQRCCNPNHLEPVTSKVNSERGGPATKTHCVNGHRLAGDNLIIRKRPRGLVIRNCRTCQLAAKRRLYRRTYKSKTAS